ncbi:hypothetical protein BU17DRAFT_62310 [Hysterangium stoloniferum]|nr:hypothetical protein BU17DRAFT_62310 [Hysterangium stoloniferum]
MVIMEILEMTKPMETAVPSMDDNTSIGLLRDTINTMVFIGMELMEVWETLECHNDIQEKGFRELNQNFWKQNEFLEKVMVSIIIIAVSEKYANKEKDEPNDLLADMVEKRWVSGERLESEDGEVQKMVESVEVGMEVSNGMEVEVE